MTRLAMFTPGPCFSRVEDGTLMFSYQVDASNSIGPRKATDADKAKFPQEWDAFSASEMMRVNPSPTIFSAKELMEMSDETIDALDAKAAKRKPGRPKKAA